MPNVERSDTRQSMCGRPTGSSSVGLDHQRHTTISMTSPRVASVECQANEERVPETRTEVAAVTGRDGNGSADGHVRRDCRRSHATEISVVTCK